MARNLVSQAVGVALAPARLSGRVVAAVFREVTGGRRDESTPVPPKPFDDVTIARKVESVIFRDRRVAKGKVDVNVADGVVWLRGEVKTPDLIRRLEARAREVPEVKGVENLLHLPKTPAPTRTDTPAAQRKTRRSRRSPGARKVTPRDVSDEAPAPAGAEPTPRAVAARAGGRRPAPLGSAPTDDLDEDPAYNPEDPGLRNLKGG